MKKRRIIVIAMLLAIAAAVFWYRGRSQSSAEAPFFSGYGEGELVYVSSPIAGELQQLAVQRGDQVEKAAFLFELEREEERAARAEAEETLRESRARVDKATMDFTRAKSLRDKRVIALGGVRHRAAGPLGCAACGGGEATCPRAGGLEIRAKAAVGAGGRAGLRYLLQARRVGFRGHARLVDPTARIHESALFCSGRASSGKCKSGRPWRFGWMVWQSPSLGKVSFVSPQAEYTLPIIYSRENRGKLVYLVEGSLAPKDARLLHPGAPIEVRLKPARTPRTWRNRQNERDRRPRRRTGGRRPGSHQELRRSRRR